MSNDPFVPLRVGDVLEGFCEGHFGRDSYEDKRVEAIGADWVVCRDTDGKVQVAVFRGDWVVDDLIKHRKET